MERSLPSRILLKNAFGVILPDLRIGRDLSVYVVEGSIRGIGSPNTFPECAEIDVSGKLIAPGFINCHTHIEDAAFPELLFSTPPGIDVLYAPGGRRHRLLRELDAEQYRSAVSRAAAQMLASGTVMAADFCTGGADAIVALRSALSSSPIEWLHFTGHSTYPVQSAEALSTNSGDLDPSVMEDIAAALDVADGFAPVHVNHTTDAGLRAILRLVRGTAGKRLATHSAASIEYDELSLRHTGRGEIERATGILEPDFLVHLTYADVADLTRVRDAGIGAVMCPRAMACLGRTSPPFLVAVDLGLMVGLGTDNAMTSTPSMLDEMGFCARVQSASAEARRRSIHASYDACTIGAARVLGVADRLGSIEPGKDATFAVFDMHGDGLQSSTDVIASLVLRASRADVAGVMIRGQIAYGALALACAA